MTAPSIRHEYGSLILDRAEDPSRWFATKFVQFAQVLFRDGGPDGNYKWTDSEQHTLIQITDQVPAPLESIERTPTIQLVLTGEQNQSLGIGYAFDVDPMTGERTYIDLITGSATYNVHAKSADVTKRIARFLQTALLRHRRELIRMAKLQHLGTQVQMGPLSAPGALVTGGSKPISTMCSVLFQYFYTEKWKTLSGFIPWGEASTASEGTAPNAGVGLEEAEKVRSINIDVRLLRPGVVEASVAALRRTAQTPDSVQTESTKQQTIVRHLDDVKSATQDKSATVAITSKK